MLIVYKDKNGTNHAEFVEINQSQTLGEARTRAQKAAAVVNHENGKRRMHTATKGMGFRVLTEKQI